MTKKTIQLLERHFDTAFSAADGIKKLRELILTLAMQGKLVPQDPNDQPASELLKEIEVEKKLLVKEGKIRMPKPLPPIKPEEIPYELPTGWAWATLQDLGFFIGGKTPTKNKATYWDGDTPWVSPKDMKYFEINNSEDHVTNEGIDSGLSIIPSDSLLMVVRSGILRRAFPVAINKVPCTINQDLKALALFNTECSNFLLLMLRGLEAFILEKLTKKGVTVESIKFEEFANTKFPIPPLPEQHRIVAKIDQLMSRCDELEKLREKSTSKQSELLNAIMAQV